MSRILGSPPIFPNLVSIMTEHQENKPIEGKIIKLHEKGWGFISSLELKFTRIFFHWSGLKQNTLGFTDLHIGMRVRFIPIQYKNQGWRAIKIEVIEGGKNASDKTTEVAGVTTELD